MKTMPSGAKVLSATHALQAPCENDLPFQHL